ncbi:succinyl-diaminopimelate desuccinylase [Ferrovum sp.]|uniref:succinyl-diaminopimelate desuccinylase n=1 Tax=Ferrovum sp. TaxID=2609467 RepID=UPI002608E960|nr:succinyl-diaminopimelate desuccinylase [Ferrovum sp.]
MTDPTLELTAELIRHPSVTPEDGGCQELIALRLAPLGFKATPLDRGEVRNLWLRRGTQSPLVVLAGHTDVVPPGPESGWLSLPFLPTIRDGFLYGRGAADMKASLAAFVTAIESVLTTHPDLPGSIALLLTSDEEGPALEGTARVVEWLEETGQIPDYCLVGEPTSVDQLGDTIKNGRRGSLSGVLTVRGIQGHVAYPHLARNPIHLTAPALADLTNTVWDQASEDFPATTFQISNLQSGTGAGNVIPGELTAWFNFRFSTASSANSLQERTRQILQRHGLDFDLQWSLSAQPFLTPHGTLVTALQEAVQHVTGVHPTLSTSGGTSDGRFLVTLGSQVVELGPCNGTIHQRNERIASTDPARLSAIYQRLLLNLLTP